MKLRKYRNMYIFLVKEIILKIIYFKARHNKRQSDFNDESYNSAAIFNIFSTNNSMNITLFRFQNSFKTKFNINV